MDYGRILKRAVGITWRHKALWFFGFLFALFSGGSGGGGGQGLQYRIGRTDLARPEWAWGIVLLMLIVVFVLAVAAIVLSNISQGALIGTVAEAEDTGSTSVRSGWRTGRSRMWPLIGIDLVTVIPAIIVALTLIAMALSPLLLLIPERDALTVMGIALAVLLLLVVVAIIIVAGTLLGIVREFAYRQCVLDSKGVWRSIRDGYRVVRTHLRPVGVMWLLLFGIDLAASVVAFPVAVLVFGLATAAGVAVYAATESIISGIVVGLMLGLPVILILTVVAGVYVAFRSTAWTLAYREVQAQP